MDTPLHAAIVTATVVQSKEVPSTGPRGKLACLDGPHERQAGALQCVELLCRYGADTALQDKMGVSSLHAVATLPGLLKMVLLSISKAHPLEDALFKGSMGAPSGPVLRSDADATLEGYHRSSGLNSESIPENSQQERSSAGLMGLAKKSGEEKVDARKSRSRVLANIRDIHGRTPLHKAAIAGSATVWNLLREAGSLPDVLDKDGRYDSPCHIKGSCFISDFLNGAGLHYTMPSLFLSWMPFSALSTAMQIRISWMYLG